MNGILQWLTNLIQQIKPIAIVNPWERGIRVRFGKNATVLMPGWHLRIPVVDSLTMFNNRLRIAAFPGQTLTTADGQTVTIAGNVGFRIDDPLAAMMSLQQPEYSCAALVQSSAATYIAGAQFDEISKEQLEEVAKSDLEKIAAGLAIEYVTITDFARVHRTFRLLGDEWRPSTKPDIHDKDA